MCLCERESEGEVPLTHHRHTKPCKPTIWQQGSQGFTLSTHPPPSISPSLYHSLFQQRQKQGATQKQDLRRQQQHQQQQKKKYDATDNYVASVVPWAKLPTSLPLSILCSWGPSSSFPWRRSTPDALSSQAAELNKYGGRLSYQTTARERRPAQENRPLCFSVFLSCSRKEIRAVVSPKEE